MTHDVFLLSRLTHVLYKDILHVNILTYCADVDEVSPILFVQLASHDEDRQLCKLRFNELDLY